MPENVTCLRCGKPMPTWAKACPHCHCVLETEADKLAGCETRTLLGCFGAAAIVVSGLLGMGGFLLIMIGAAMGRDPLLPVLACSWLGGTVAVVAVGARLVQASRTNLSRPLWGAGGMFLWILLLGVCTWILVIGTCATR